MELQDLKPTPRLMGGASPTTSQSSMTAGHGTIEQGGNRHPTATHSRRVSHIDDCRVVGLSGEDEAFYTSFGQEKRQRVHAKTDIRLMPVLCLLYLFAQLDRINIANAKIEGLMEDIGMTDDEWNIMLAIFFIPYFLLEVSSNMILHRALRPSLYISFLATSWGAIMLCHGFVYDYEGLLTVRSLLGVFQSGFFPAAMYLCSQWYPRRQLALRLSLSVVVSASSGILSGLLAAAISRMDGLGGYESWRWIFLLEGGATVVLGLVAPFLLIDSPKAAAKWLDKEEIRYLEIMNLTSTDGNDPQTNFLARVYDLLAIVLDLRLWAYGLILHSVSACGYGLKFSIPSALTIMGFSKTKSQLLSTVPYLFGAMSSIGVSLGTHRTSLRLLFMSPCLVIMNVGVTVMLLVTRAAESKAAGIIVGMSFVTSGIFPMGPITCIWASSNLGNASRRSVGIAFIMGLSSLGGLTGSFLYRESDFPDFDIAFTASTSLTATAAMFSLGLALSYVRENSRRARIPEEEVRRQYTEEELVQLGDKSPLFRYTL